MSVDNLPFSMHLIERLTTVPNLLSIDLFTGVVGSHYLFMHQMFF